MIEFIKAVIIAAALAHGVSAAGMVNLACNESTYRAWVWNGQYFGLFQLGAGMRQRFYAAGYDDISDPAQQADFVAVVLANGGYSNWAGTWGRRCRWL